MDVGESQSLGSEAPNGSGIFGFPGSEPLEPESAPSYPKRAGTECECVHTQIFFLGLSHIPILLWKVE